MTDGAQPLKNQRHERFAQNIALGKSATEAYKNAGYSPKGAGVSGHHLLKNLKVAARIEYLKAQAAERALVSAEMVIEGLQREAQGLGPDTSSSARSRALELLGKHLGLFTDKIEHSGGVTITFTDETDD